MCTPRETSWSHGIATADPSNWDTAKTLDWNPTSVNSAKVSFSLSFHRCPCGNAIPVDPQLLWNNKSHCDNPRDPVSTTGGRGTQFLQAKPDKPSDSVGRWIQHSRHNCAYRITRVHCGFSTLSPQLLTHLEDRDSLLDDGPDTLWLCQTASQPVSS